MNVQLFSNYCLACLHAKDTALLTYCSVCLHDNRAAVLMLLISLCAVETI
jgi:hypothetical protein